jgi:UrcA family protein
MIMKANRSHVLTACLSSLLGLAATIATVDSAQAAPAPTVTVSYRDLDLSRPTDVQALYRRLQHAAAEVCGPVPEGELPRYLAWQRCYHIALDSAVLGVRSPELLAIYRASPDGGAAAGAQG